MHERDSTNLRRGVKGKSRGFGFVSFRDAEACSRAVEAQFHEIGGRHVEVKVAVPEKMMAVETKPKALGGRGAPEAWGSSQVTRRRSDQLADKLADKLTVVHVEDRTSSLKDVPGSVDISRDLQLDGMTEPDAYPSAVTLGMCNSYSMPMMPAAVPPYMEGGVLVEPMPSTLIGEACTGWTVSTPPTVMTAPLYQESFVAQPIPAAVPMVLADPRAIAQYTNQPAWGHGMAIAAPMAAPITTPMPMPMTAGWVAPIPYAEQ